MYQYILYKIYIDIYIECIQYISNTFIFQLFLLKNITSDNVCNYLLEIHVLKHTSPSYV